MDVQDALFGIRAREFLKIRPTSVSVRKHDSPEIKTAKTFGGRLFEAVFGGSVRECLRSSLDESARHDQGLRIRLHLSDVPELVDVPWEFLYNAELNRFLSHSNKTPVIRYLDLAGPIGVLRVKPPLRLLSMISSPSDYAQLNVKREWAKLQGSVGKLVQFSRDHSSSSLYEGHPCGRVTRMS